MAAVTRTSLITDDIHDIGKPEIWCHRDDLLYEFTNKGYRDEEDFASQARYIPSFAAALIERPWLDSRYMGW